MESPALDKASRRKELLAARRALTSDEVAAAGAGLLASAQVRPEFQAARCVALYLAMGTEPDTTPLLDWFRAHDVRVLLPLLYDDNDLGWGPADSGLHPGRLGLTEPLEDLGPNAIASAALVICPALAIDLNGVRLGRGGGSYDRALARAADVPIWAAVYPSEVVEALPRDAHDQYVDAALTPSGLRVTNRSDVRQT
ncbi:5-formyltetrahydrofolate cyclo-ligase [Kribbella sp. NBC_01245]|uniref:5-formyltetrahydrofolate cyclo-ligase n=1 Tax=Kribbella sp. NBC_01245 TaxID=2903578 RepID=UPI002E2C721B|nr:5-formyltetrahydrofolate cyclo-ligase [Kribbella sp. NBC_01245]